MTLYIRKIVKKKSHGITSRAEGLSHPTHSFSHFQHAASELSDPLCLSTLPDVTLIALMAGDGGSAASERGEGAVAGEAP
jgi:hypothetical protein